MDIKPPNDGWVHNVLETSPFLATLVLSLWAGVVQYVQRVREGETWCPKALLMDLVICTFAGMLTYFLCEWANIHGPLAAVLIAVSAHMGTKAIGSMVALRDKILYSSRRDN